MKPKINFNDYSHIIFDFDGTLADTFNVSLKAYNDYAVSKNKPIIDLQTAKEMKSMSYREIRKKLNIRLWNIPSILKTVQNNVQNHMHEAKFFPGMLELIYKLKSQGKKIGIVTSNSAENVEKFLEQKNVSKDVYLFIYGSPSVFGKAKKFRSMFKKHNFDAKDALYVGDEVRDIKASRKVNMDVAAVTWGWNEKNLLEEAKPDYLVESVEQLI
jgi:phosphoglycolate phosphatase